MPTSRWHQINEIMEKIMELRPDSVLDIGIGFGKFGFLCREYLELWDGREIYGDWRKIIDGIEVNGEYVTELQKQIYDNIYVGNALEFLPNIKNEYDLMLLIDVFEHFNKEDGKEIIKLCKEKSKKVLICVPINPSPQKDAFGNPYEEHKSRWTKKEFEKYSDDITNINGNSYLVII